MVRNNSLSPPSPPTLSLYVVFTEAQKSWNAIKNLNSKNTVRCILIKNYRIHKHKKGKPKI
jgi:hypothetical protein